MGLFDRREARISVQTELFGLLGRAGPAQTMRDWRRHLAYPLQSANRGLAKRDLPLL